MPSSVYVVLGRVNGIFNGARKGVFKKKCNSVQEARDWFAANHRPTKAAIAADPTYSPPVWGPDDVDALRQRPQGQQGIAVTMSPAQLRAPPCRYGHEMSATTCPPIACVPAGDGGPAQALEGITMKTKAQAKESGAIAAATWWPALRKEYPGTLYDQCPLAKRERGLMGGYDGDIPLSDPTLMKSRFTALPPVHGAEDPFKGWSTTRAAEIDAIRVGMEAAGATFPCKECVHQNCKHVAAPSVE
eukprot:gene25703-22975_t